MPEITLYHEHPSTVTSVPNRFIDEHMTDANGEYVKIYLYLLRSLTQPGCSISLSRLADRFNCTERDVLRALKYWEKLSLFTLEFDDAHHLSGIRFLSDAPVDRQEMAQAPTDAADHFIQAVAPAMDQETRSADDLSTFCEKEDIKELVFITEQYLGRTLHLSDLNTIFFWYDQLALSAELIEFLIENCVASGHTSLHYMQKIAEDYAAHEIHTVDQAKQFTNERSALYYAVMKAFGIRGRNLAPSETNYLQQWSGRFGFSPEMITEACNRTMRAIHEPSFGYANTILKSWHDQGILTPEDVQKADVAYQQNAEQQRSRRAQANAVGASNRFLNFSQRNNNYEELQQQLIQHSLH